MTFNERNMLFQLAKAISASNTAISQLTDVLGKNYDMSSTHGVITTSLDSLNKCLELMESEWSDK